MMRTQTLVFICILSLLSSGVVADEFIVSDNNTPTSSALDAALQRNLKKPGSPFLLQVNCTDQKGIRSLDLFAGGTAIWNDRSQIKLPPAARSRMLETLLDQGFSKFETYYGGHGRPIKKAAAARISCRIWVKVEDLQKNSVQQAGGEPSTPLTSLAAVLLDQAEQFAQTGITPNDLQDALDKLSAGQLALQVLRLRFVDLPAQGENKSGSILHIRGGKFSLQAYSPGQVITKQIWKPLEHKQYLELLTALQFAHPETLSHNLWSEDQLQFEVQVLAHKKVVHARPFTAVDSSAKGDDQQRFSSILTVLRKLGQ